MTQGLPTNDGGALPGLSGHGDHEPATAEAVPVVVAATRTRRSHGTRFAITCFRKGGARWRSGVLGLLIQFRRHCLRTPVHAATPAAALENEPVSRGESRWAHVAAQAIPVHRPCHPWSRVARIPVRTVCSSI